MSTPYTLNQPKPYMNLLIFGQQGVGKTVLAATAMGHPDLDEVLFCDVEGGLLSIAGKHPRVMNIGRGENGMSSGKALADLDAVAEAIAAKKPGYEKIRTVVIDSGTEFQAQDLEAIKKANGKPDEPAGIADYNKNSGRMRRIFRVFRDIKVNVIITALVTTITKKEDIDQIVEVRPAFTRAVAESIMGFVDFIWFLSLNAKGERILLTQPTGPYRVKTRSPEFAEAMGKVVVDPHLGKLYDLLCKTVKDQELKEIK